MKSLYKKYNIDTHDDSEMNQNNQICFYPYGRNPFEYKYNELIGSTSNYQVRDGYQITIRDVRFTLQSLYVVRNR